MGLLLHTTSVRRSCRGLVAAVAGRGSDGALVAQRLTAREPAEIVGEDLGRAVR
jgi:hypothetical protein